MLIKYSVENFKSIKDKIQLNLDATSVSELQESIIEKEGDSYLPLAAIYGPNGGGKSNIIESLFVLRNKIILPVMNSIESDYQKNVNVKMTPFLFNKENIDLPISFEIVFSNKIGEYEYKISFKHNKVLYEKMEIFKYSTNRKTFLYERNNNNVNVGDEFKKINIFKSISESISEEIPILSLLGITSRTNEIIDDIFDWFFNGIRVGNYANPILETQFVDLKIKNEKQIFLDLLKEMNIDISDYIIKKEGEGVNIFTLHNINGYEVKINYLDESSGTQKIFSLAPRIIESLLDGSTLVIDELDAKLHPLILKHIIELYNDKKSNKHGAQLIFTSHDMITMNNELLRRDEIWFAAKGRDEDTQLYSLIEFKDEDGTSIRKDAKFNKQYLEGKYGADPYLRRIINWDKIKGE